MPRVPFRALSAFALAALVACATRPMTGAERAFTATVQGEGLDTGAVRVTRGAVIGGFSSTREPRPYVSCRERILPPETEQKVAWSVAGFVVGQHLYVSRSVWKDDFLGDYPVTLPLADAMFVAHEMTHIWQWQHRESTGYAPWRAASEHSRKGDPYLFDLAPDRTFADYDFEQQASLVEEFVCCRALDPEGLRTERLYDLLRPVLPGLARHSVPTDVTLPWAAAETHGICAQPQPGD